MQNRLLYGFAATLLLAPDGVAATCYFPNGTAGVDGLHGFRPCDGADTRFAAQCCDMDAGDKCQPNGLCRDGYRRSFYRASCTNEDWSGCQSVCPDVMPDQSIQVMQCGSGNSWCCMERMDMNTCCNDASRRFQLELRQPTMTSTTAPTSPSQTARETEKSSNNNSGDDSHQRNLAAFVGAIVGAVIFVVTASTIFYVFRKYRQRKKLREEGDMMEAYDRLEMMQQQQPSDGPAAPPAAGYYAPARSSEIPPGWSFKEPLEGYYAPGAATAAPPAPVRSARKKKEKPYVIAKALPRIQETETDTSRVQSEQPDAEQTSQPSQPGLTKEKKSESPPEQAEAEKATPEPTPEKATTEQTSRASAEQAEVEKASKDQAEADKVSKPPGEQMSGTGS